jgi:hypothetical protein
MPQLDLLLFSSQCFTGIVFVLGFMYFSKILLPYISFFLKIEEFDTLNTLDISDELLDDQEVLFDFMISNNLFLRTFSGFVYFLERKTFTTSILL